MLKLSTCFHPICFLVPSHQGKYIKNYKKDINNRYIHRVNFYSHYNNVKYKKGYDIHHINGNKCDNRPLNLINIPTTLHKWIHFYLDELPSRTELFKLKKKFKILWARRATNGKLDNAGMIKTLFYLKSNRKNYVFRFGKYKGSKYLDVYNKDPTYLFWLYKNTSLDDLLNDIIHKDLDKIKLKL